MRVISVTIVLLAGLVMATKRRASSSAEQDGDYVETKKTRRSHVILTRHRLKLTREQIPSAVATGDTTMFTAAFPGNDGIKLSDIFSNQEIDDQIGAIIRAGNDKLLEGSWGAGRYETCSPVTM